MGKMKKQPKLPLPFNDNFQQYIFHKLGDEQEEGRILKRVKAMSEDDIKIRFNGRSRRWLLKELNRWKQIVHSEGKREFKTTMQNLQVLCNATDATPNQILLSDVPSMDQRLSILLSYQALEDLQ